MLLLLACDGSGHTADTATPEPFDGVLPASRWGGDRYWLEIASGGSAHLVGSCDQGVTTSAVVEDGAFSWPFTWCADQSYVDTAFDTAALDASVFFEGTVHDDTLSGSIHLPAADDAVVLTRTSDGPSFDVCD